MLIIDEALNSEISRSIKILVRVLCEEFYDFMNLNFDKNIVYFCI